MEKVQKNKEIKNRNAAEQHRDRTTISEWRQIPSDVSS
jgi:hypothetical protein